jgi:protein TonB
MDLRIAAFVTVSTLTHGAAALWIDVGNTPQLTIGGEVQALRVALLPRKTITTTQTRPAPSTRESTNLTKTSEQQSVERPVHTRISEASQSTADEMLPQTTSSPLALHNTIPALKPHSATENASEQISAALRNRLTQHFEYPWLARKRGWEGRVLLSLRVASNGDLSNWKIVQTSGYRTLDQSALKAVRRIEHLPQARHWLNGGSLEVQLPVQYKLLDS